MASSLRKTFSKVKHVLQESAAELTSPIAFHDAKSKEKEANGLSKGEQRAKAREEEKARNQKAHDEYLESLRLRRLESDNRAAAVEPKDVRARYGTAAITEECEKELSFVEIKSLSAPNEGQEVTFRARIHTTRRMSSNLAFIVLRQQTSTIQGVLQEKDNVISSHMVRWAERLPPETIVFVTGAVQKPAKKITGTTIHDVEIRIELLHVLTQPVKPLPFDVYEIEEQEVKRRESDGDHEHHRISDRARLTNRLIDLRSPTSHSIFRIQAGVCDIFRSTLTAQGFIEIHTPKLQPGATESGASVFEVSYFDRSAFLAQSPQLAKQMCMAADFERVFEIGPVFRAENSNTHRHLTEYIGLDLEMTIRDDYHEAMDIIDNMLKSIFKGIHEKYRGELDIIKKHFPCEDLVWLEKTPVIAFADAIKLLADSGWTFNGKAPSPNEDLSTPAEIALGDLIKKKYQTDYYILDKFPISARPFYTMPDPTDPEVANAFDIFVRGQEIISGGQRVHDADVLISRMKNLGVSTVGMEDYLEGFEWGAPPHAGCGVGLERLVMLMLNLGNIRFASLFHRDPKSLPARPPTFELRHPEASTNPPPWKQKDAHTRRSSDAGKKEHEYQPLEKLIANYGDATNTTWLDDRYQIWRHPPSGAAVGYVPSAHGRFAIVVGNPLCATEQYSHVINDFLRWLKSEANLRPIWLLVDELVEEILGGRLGWSTLTCAAEQRINKTSALHFDNDVNRKLRRAEASGLQITEYHPLPEDIQKKCDERVIDWLRNRKGTQVHLTNINPWRDPSHRRYFVAMDDSHTVHALVVLAQLSTKNGYQVKYSLDFPGAPSGTIEAIITHAIKAVTDSGTRSVTFGVGATSDFVPVHHLDGITVKILRHTYKALAKHLKLANKSEFKEKLGAEEEPVYICYPRRGLGSSGVKAVLDFFEAEE